MDFIIRIIDFENFDRLIADERMVKEWAALLSLMKRTWLGVSSIYHPPPPPSLFISIRRSLICAANTPLLEELGHSRSRFSKEGLASLRQ
jgi:hypothetical protein